MESLDLGGKSECSTLAQPSKAQDSIEKPVSRRPLVFECSGYTLACYQNNRTVLKISDRVVETFSDFGMLLAWLKHRKLPLPFC